MQSTKQPGCLSDYYFFFATMELLKQQNIHDFSSDADGHENASILPSSFADSIWDLIYSLKPQLIVIVVTLICFLSPKSCFLQDMSITALARR